MSIFKNKSIGMHAQSSQNDFLLTSQAAEQARQIGKRAAANADDISAAQPLTSQSNGAPAISLKINKEEGVAQFQRVVVRRNNRFYTLVLFATIILCLLLVLTLGVTTFKSIATSRLTSQDERLETQIVAADIRRIDESESIRRDKGPEGDALVLIERLSSGDYETRLYLNQGNLVQEYAIAGSPITPEAATIIAPAKTFEWKLTDKLLTIRTDSGETNIAIRSANPIEGGE